jgi:transcriptional regulator with XRE-family HTH domain
VRRYLGCVNLANEEADIGKRMRLVRKEHGVSRRLAAAQTGLSQDQIKRIELGEVGVRFFPAWHFCRFTDTNPLWLAFGDPEPRFGFVAAANSEVREDARFLDVMRTFGGRYKQLRFFTHASWRTSGSVFSDREDPLISTQPIESSLLAPKKNVATLLLKRYLMTEVTAEVPPTWSELRSLLVSKTESAEAKKELAKGLGVTLAALSQWRSGANAPSADNALQIFRWIREVEAKEEKQSAGTATTEPARKTRKRKSNYEKPKSDPKNK